MQIYSTRWHASFAVFLRWLHLNNLCRKSIAQDGMRKSIAQDGIRKSIAQDGMQVLRIFFAMAASKYLCCKSIAQDGMRTKPGQ